MQPLTGLSDTDFELLSHLTFGDMLSLYDTNRYFKKVLDKPNVVKYMSLMLGTDTKQLPQTFLDLIQNHLLSMSFRDSLIFAIDNGLCNMLNKIYNNQNMGRLDAMRDNDIEKFEEIVINYTEDICAAWISAMKSNSIHCLKIMTSFLQEMIFQIDSINFDGEYDYTTHLYPLMIEAITHNNYRALKLLFNLDDNSLGHNFFDWMIEKGLEAAIENANVHMLDFLLKTDNADNIDNPRQLIEKSYKKNNTAIIEKLGDKYARRNVTPEIYPPPIRPDTISQLPKMYSDSSEFSDFSDFSDSSDSDGSDNFW
jgi:hypothetical protein